VCFGNWNVELSPRSLVSQPVMEVIKEIETSSAPTIANYQGLNLNMDSMFSGMSFNVDLGITEDMMMPEKTSPKERWTTTTTTIVTPGIDNTAQAMAIKEVADNLLGATGAVLGVTAAVMTGQYRSVLAGAVYGDMAGRWVGEGMWNLIN
jgi:hypothetical protein